MTAIATNPDTGIRYYSDPGPQEGASVDLFIAIRGDVVTNSGGIRWPNLFGSPYDEPGLAFYLKTPPKIREFDDRVFYEVSTWGPVDYADPKPGGPHGTWEETLEVIKHPEDILLRQVEAELLQANSRLYPANQDPLLRELVNEARLRDAAGTATEEMIDMLFRHQAVLDAGRKNFERSVELKKQIVDGESFDLTAGWTYEIP